jgi:hypothetical protein
MLGVENQANKKLSLRATSTLLDFMLEGMGENDCLEGGDTHWKWANTIKTLTKASNKSWKEQKVSLIRLIWVKLFH